MINHNNLRPWIETLADPQDRHEIASFVAISHAPNVTRLGHVYRSLVHQHALLHAAGLERTQVHDIVMEDLLFTEAACARALTSLWN